MAHRIVSAIAFSELRYEQGEMGNFAFPVVQFPLGELSLESLMPVVMAQF